MPRDIRRLALQTLYQIDVRGESELDEIRQGIDDSAEFDPGGFRAAERQRAFELARAAFAARARSDATAAELAPTWPAHRQPALDRSIIRLAIHEMRSETTNPKIVVNEAIELAKAYSTEKSAAFINGVLDKVLKQVLAEQSQVQPVKTGAVQSAEDATGGEG